MNFSAAICYFPKITYARARNLLTRFSNSESAFLAELDDLVQIGFDENIAHEFISWRETFNVEKITNELVSQEIETVSIFDSTYPSLLKEINDPPPVLFFRGKLPTTLNPSISVVGTRRCTVYGKQITNQIVSELSQNNITIVSGLALGIDGIAHEAALQNNATTIAVLGSGVDKKHVYPSSHGPLAEKIIKNGGAIISEYPPGFEPTQYSFPARNRIIAGLTLGTLVTEAPTSSGALITAARCLDYNRDVFAIPHPANSLQGAGGNRLLKNGATLVTCAKDILNSLEITNGFRSIEPPIKKEPTSNDPEENTIITLLASGQKHIDDIVKSSNLPIDKATAKLTILEMSGRIENIGGMTYILLK